MKYTHSVAKSSNIEKVTYDSETKVLSIVFKPSGKEYFYVDVPQSIYTGITTAESAGKFFYAYIRGKYSEK